MRLSRRFVGSLTVAAATVIVVAALRCAAASAPAQVQTVDSRPQAEQAVRPQPEPAHVRYNPDKYTTVTVVSDTDVAPKPVNLPRDAWFEAAWSAGIEDSAVVSALVNTKGVAKTIRFRLPSESPRYDSAVARSVRASVFSPLRSEGLRVEAWVRLKYESKYGPDSPPPPPVTRP
jgi:hypothetical protein